MFKRALTLTLIVGLSVAPALGQERKRKAAAEEPKAEAPAVAEKPAPYDPKLMRLAEILGSVSYLRNLCKGGESDWREMMQELLGEETANEPQRTARLTAAFNRGYRSFAATYVKCTPQAIAAEEAYRAEGATLATEITARFGN
jgi:uncharacterized protein (TIGR02301 family)